MHIIYSDLATSPFALSLVLLHLLVLTQCAIKFGDYTWTKQQLESLR